MRIRPNVKLGVDISEIIDLRDDQPEKEASNGKAFEQLSNPLSFMLKRPVERLEEDHSPSIQVIPSG